MLPAWPTLPSTIAEVPPVFGESPPAPWRTGAQPPPGPAGTGVDPATATQRPSALLDLTIPWSTLADQSFSPADLGRLGPITAQQARLLALTAAPDPSAQWRVIVTDADGYAIGVERVRRGRVCPRQPGRPPGLVGRVTVTLPAAALDRPPPVTWAPGGDILTAILRAARRAAARAAADRAADEQVPDGCAHTAASAGYRPPPRLREYIEARDQTCRHRSCRQPAWRADLDHTRPWHLGGPTCRCNLGGWCRTHHQVKQGPGWTVTQLRPGHFQITTPAGRSYDVQPAAYPC
jgi:hypothetical protein